MPKSADLDLRRLEEAAAGMYLCTREFMLQDPYSHRARRGRRALWYTLYMRRGLSSNTLARSYGVNRATILLGIRRITEHQLETGELPRVVTRLMLMCPTKVLTHKFHTHQTKDGRQLDFLRNQKKDKDVCFQCRRPRKGHIPKETIGRRAA